MTAFSASLLIGAGLNLMLDNRFVAGMFIFAAGLETLISL